MEALYIHIPFCNHICTYCDFYKMVAKTNVKEKYIKYLIQELQLRKDLLKDVKTVYIGGGTPTSLPLNLLDFFLYHLHQEIDLKNVIEFTIEANPTDITLDLAMILKKYHINRVSLGVQSFNEQKLKFLGRNHNQKIVTQAIKILHKVGINNINIDLIYGTPNDSFKIVKKDLQKCINLGVKHISAYSLILEEKTILYHLYKQNKFTPIDEDKEYHIYKKINRFLKKYNYHHYEISNYAIKNYESKHNLVYWANEKYLGIGAAASYYIDNVRYTNIMNLEKYFSGIEEQKLKYIEETTLTPLEQMQEEMIMGLRKIHGIDIKQFHQKFNQDLFQVFPIINDLIKKKLLIKKRNKLYIPKKRLYLSNRILAEFI